MSQMIKRGTKRTYEQLKLPWSMWIAQWLTRCAQSVQCFCLGNVTYIFFLDFDQCHSRKLQNRIGVGECGYGYVSVCFYILLRTKLPGSELLTVTRIWLVQKTKQKNPLQILRLKYCIWVQKIYMLERAGLVKCVCGIGRNYYRDEWEGEKRSCTHLGLQAPTCMVENVGSGGN